MRLSVGLHLCGMPVSDSEQSAGRCVRECQAGVRGIRAVCEWRRVWVGCCRRACRCE